MKKLFLFGLVFLLLMGFTSAALIDDQISYYKFDGDADDAHSTNDGTVTGATLTTGKINQAYYYDGVNDQITYPSSIIDHTQPFSFSFWFNSTDLTGDELLFVGDGARYYVDLQDSTIYFQFNDGGWKLISTEFTSGYNFLAVTYDGSSEYEMFLNGASVGTTGGVDPVSDANYKLATGYRSTNNDRYYNGDIDELALWQREINITDVTELYNSNNGLQYPYVEPPKTINDSSESTAFVKQVGSTSFTTTMTTIISSDFNVTNNNTPIYGGYSFNIESNSNTVAYCEILIAGQVYANVTRSNSVGELGSVYIQTPVFISETGNYTQTLQCQKLSGGGFVTVSKAEGIGHFLINQDNEFINYEFEEYEAIAVTSGSVYTNIASFNITTSNKTNESVTDTRANHIVLEGAFTYTNNAATENLGIYANINGTNCTKLPRTVDNGAVGSVSYDCFLKNITSNSTYEVNLYANGTNAEYSGILVAKNFFIDNDEIIGGTGDFTGLTFSGDTFTPLAIAVDAGNRNHDNANVFSKLSYAIETDQDTTVSIYFNLTNGQEYTTTIWERDFSVGDIGVIIGNDVLENISKDNYTVQVYANCGSVGATCTIRGGQTGGYVSDLKTTIINAFDIYLYDITNTSFLIEEYTAQFDGSEISTTNGTIKIFTPDESIDLTFSFGNTELTNLLPNYNYNKTFYGRTINGWNTSNELNTTLYPATINLESPDSIINYEPVFTFNYTNYAWDFNPTCRVWDNRSGTLINTINVTSAGSNQTTTVNSNITDEGQYVWRAMCTTFEPGIQTAETPGLLTFKVDNTNPVINFIYPSEDNTTRTTTNVNLDVQVSDLNNYEALVNVTAPNGSTYFYQTYNTSGSVIYNITELINLTGSEMGTYNVFVEAADGHTKQVIAPMRITQQYDGLTFNDHVTITAENGEPVIAKYKLDRYSFSFDAMQEDINYFTVTSSGVIDIVEDSKYLGHLVIKPNSNPNDWYWLDFENEQGYNVKLTKLSDNEVRVKVYGEGKIDFNSIGRLNVVNKTVSFYFDESNITSTETFDENIVKGFSTVITNLIHFNDLKYNVSTREVFITVDGIEYTPIESIQSSTDILYAHTINVPINFSESTITHFWTASAINLDTGIRDYYVTNNQTQFVTDVFVGVCNASITHEILNISFQDEITENSINVNVSQEFRFYDGTYYYNVDTTQLNTSGYNICTNLDPINLTYDWLLTGQLRMEKDNYVSRALTFNIGSDFEVSNDPTAELLASLISINDSQTVSFEWLTTDYTVVDGVMEAYRCNTDGSRTLVESVPVASGIGTVNLQLFEQLYSFNIIIGEQKYNGNYSICSPVSQTEVRYYVDVGVNSLVPVQNLMFTNCTVTNQSNIVTMTWSSNEILVNDIEGCIVGYRNVMGAKKEVYRECDTNNFGLLQVQIPDNNNVYYVGGVINNQGNSYTCTDQIHFGDDDTGFDAGNEGIFAVFLLVAGIALFFAGNGLLANIGAGVAVVIAWILGVLAVGWIVPSALLFICVIIAFVGRGAKK